MKRKRVYQVGYWVLFIILLLTVSCQVEPDMSEYSVIVEDETEEVADDITDDIIDPVDDPIEDPIIETPEPIEVITTMEYVNNVDYHFPASMGDKQIRVIETGQTYEFIGNGIILPTNAMLYPNPVTPDMFINAVEGQTTESVEIVTNDDGVAITETGFSYAIHMTGKCEYKGNLYYGEVKIIVVYLNGVLTLNGLGAEFVE